MIAFPTTAGNQKLFFLSILTAVLTGGLAAFFTDPLIFFYGIIYK